MLSIMGYLLATATCLTRLFTLSFLSWLLAHHTRKGRNNFQLSPHYSTFKGLLLTMPDAAVTMVSVCKRILSIYMHLHKLAKGDSTPINKSKKEACDSVPWTG